MDSVEILSGDTIMERRRCTGCERRRAAILAGMKRKSGAIRSTGGAYVRGNTVDPLPKDKTTEKETSN